ncbi:MAG: TetR/AcrR family transcriptional regulator [Candidatus Cloacimonetes bacterium]|nr:TetR/AcrR family transcriptional regulator [Candidatus Cloacimonadota bacterium]
MLSHKEIEKSEKALLLVKTAEELFMKHGIRRVSVEEICSKGKASKVTFYKYFKNKQAVVLYILKRQFNKAMQQLKDLTDNEVPIEQILSAIMQIKIEMSKQWSEEFILDLYSFEDTREELVALKKHTTMMWRNILESAQAKGQLRKDINIDLLLLMEDKLRELIYDDRARKLYPSLREMAIEVGNLYFYGILPR